jgi:hypothetical protein
MYLVGVGKHKCKKLPLLLFLLEGHHPKQNLVLSSHLEKSHWVDTVTVSMIACMELITEF